MEATSISNNNSRTSLIGYNGTNKPLGIRLLGSCFRFKSQQSKRNYYKGLVLFLTFVAYASFHMGRRPLSVVKNVLNRNCSAIKPEKIGDVDHIQQLPYINLGVTTSVENDTSCDWAPFNNDATANQLLALLDTAFLSAYAITMFGSGIVAERMNLRYFITLGSLVSGFGLVAFGLAYHMDIHSMIYFFSIQVISGAAQSTGWPVVVTCVSHWFEPNRRGLIYGLWNSHTNLGNILGATIAGFFVEKDWGLSFIVPGIIMVVVGLILFLFLVPSPDDVDLNESNNSSFSYGSRGNHRDQSKETNQDHYDVSTKSSRNKLEPITNNEKSEAVSFLQALSIPGVVEYSLCLFFSKLVSYTFLYWLPRFISLSTQNNSEKSAYLSTPFDMGGILGAIVAGYLSDRYKANGITCTVMLVLAIPSMFIYQLYGPASSLNNIALQLLVGSLVNGPYCLITTAVSADLGNRVKDGRAMATVAAIIDGMGSLGAVVGPLIAGFASSSDNWKLVFLMLMISDVLAAACLIRVTVQELRMKLLNQEIDHTI